MGPTRLGCLSEGHAGNCDDAQRGMDWRQGGRLEDGCNTWETWLEPTLLHGAGTEDYGVYTDLEETWLITGTLGTATPTCNHRKSNSLGTRAARGRTTLKANPGVTETFCILIVVVFSWAYAFAKLHPSLQLK